MRSLRNRVNLIGNVGADPEIKTFDNGKKMAKMSLATQDVYKNQQGEKVTDVQWHHLVAWGQPAIVAEKYIHKGKEVAVEGKLVSRAYEGKDGVKKYFTEIIVDGFLLLDRKKTEK